jgi:SH3 domain protein
MMRFYWWVLPLLLPPLTVSAETAYITDQLRLGMHNAQDTSDRAFRTLESGQALEILGRDRNYAHVRLPDGAEGYVKAAYLVTDKPARLIVQESQAASARLQEELARTRAAFAEPAATIAALEQQLGDQSAELSDSNSRVAELTDRNKKLADRYSQYKYSLPVSWVGGAVAVCLLAGFLGGLWWTDYRSRKRHGGIRIY